MPPVVVTVNFWYKAASVPEVTPDKLNGQQRVCVMRNIEKMLSTVLHDPQEVSHTIVMNTEVT